MRRLVVASLMIFLAGLAAPGFAGTVYVPVVASLESNGVQYETRVSITNGGPGRAEFHIYFIEADTDGTVRPNDEGQAILLNPGATFETTVDHALVGLMEISGDPDLVYHARLVGLDGGSELLGVQLPIITGANVAPAGSKAYLQGWLQDATHMATFGIINLGQEATNCTVDVRRKGGVPLVQNVVVPVKPLSHIHLGEDIVGLLGDFVDARVEVSCEQPFYTYSTTMDRDGPEIAVIRHSALGTDALQEPGEGGTVCPPRSVCFEQAGVFHIPTRSRPVLRVITTPPPGVYSRINFRLTVTHGGWSASNPDGRHNILWFARDGNGDLFAYVNALGPNKNIFRLGHGIGIPHGSKPRVEKKFEMIPGETYTIDYAYDAAQAFILLKLFDSSGEEVLRLSGTPNIRSITITDRNQMLWDFGNTGANPKEPASLGWVFRDLFVEFVP